MTGKLRALVCSYPKVMSGNKEWGKIGSTAASPNPWLHSYLQTDRENITRPQDDLVGRAMPQKVLPVYHHGGRGQLSSAGPETRTDVSVVRDGQAGLELRE